MKDFRHTIEQSSALLFVSQEVRFVSSIGRHAMLNASWLDTVESINEKLDIIERFISYIESPSHKKGIDELELVLSELVNIRGSIELLKQPDSICTDIDLFEIKKLAIIEEKARNISDEYGIALAKKPDLNQLLNVIDPEGQRLPTFYLSSVFDPRLDKLRNEQQLTDNEIKKGQIADTIAKLEDEVRERLSRALELYADDLLEVLKAFACDVLALGKARWAISSGAVRPIPKVDGSSILFNMYHPEIKRNLEDQGIIFQPVSIDFVSEPTVITGANMAGKSVLLSSIAVSQILMQYGWYVPAAKAELVVVDEVMLSIGDGQDFNNGLSSFGAEIVRLNEIITMVKNGHRVLALIDEPARSTNPTEGQLLVTGLIKFLMQYHVRSIITTHYSNIGVDIRRWRVKGFVEDRLVHPLKVNQLNQCIDYSLEEDKENIVPQEALRIARILGVDEELLEMCKVD